MHLQLIMTSMSLSLQPAGVVATCTIASSSEQMNLPASQLQPVDN